MRPLQKEDANVPLGFALEAEDDESGTGQAKASTAVDSTHGGRSARQAGRPIFKELVLGFIDAKFRNQSELLVV